MGSKRAMLRNGLGAVILHESDSHRRIVDLFCGSAAVAWFAAENTRLPVLAVDLQSYAVTLARSVIERLSILDARDLCDQWLSPVEVALSQPKFRKMLRWPSQDTHAIEELVWKATEFCAIHQSFGP